MKTWEITVPKDVSVDGSGYTMNGKRYVRVTRTLSVIAKNFLTKWYLKVGKKRADSIMKNRQILGTKVHSLFEHILKGDDVYTETYNQEVQMDVRLFKNFIEKCVISYDALEQKVWSDEYGYAGTMDFIGNYKTNKEWIVQGDGSRFEKGAFIIIDYKTSRDIYEDYWLQLSAYAWAFYERTGIKVDGAAIAQFRDGKIRIKERTWDELMQVFEVYKAVLTVYRWKYGLKDKKDA